jgi:Transposase DDE domain group 1
MASGRTLSTCRLHRGQHEPPGRRVVAFYNKRGTCEQWIKEGKGAIKWTRLSCRSFAANAVRLQLHALAYNLGNFLRTLATPEPIKGWSLTSLKKKLIKICAKIVSHGRFVAFQMGPSHAAEAAKTGQKSSAPSMRPPIQPETGTICAGSAFIWRISVRAR